MFACLCVLLLFGCAVWVLEFLFAEEEIKQLGKDYEKGLMDTDGQGMYFLIIYIGALLAYFSVIWFEKIIRAKRES